MKKSNEYKNAINNLQNNNGGWPSQGNDPMEFQAIDDDDIPF